MSDEPDKKRDPAASISGVPPHPDKPKPAGDTTDKKPSPGDEDDKKPKPAANPKDAAERRPDHEAFDYETRGQGQGLKTLNALFKILYDILDQINSCETISAQRKVLAGGLLGMASKSIQQTFNAWAQGDELGARKATDEARQALDDAKKVTQAGADAEPMVEADKTPDEPERGPAGPS